MVSKHRSVLRSINFTRGRVLLANVDEGITYDSLEIDEGLWFDMGSPETMTLTLEPGDLLNVETFTVERKRRGRPPKGR